MSDVQIEDSYIDDAYIETYTGRRFYITDPAPDFNIQDIAHALSLTCRYGGHCKRFYSVAEHSVLVARIMEHCAFGDPLEGLLHDATEAYVGDMPAPFKHLVSDFTALDEQLEEKLARWAGMLWPRQSAYKIADWFALFIEARYLMPGEGRDYKDPMVYRNAALTVGDQMNLRAASFGMEPRRAENLFLETYERLTQRRAA
ncbi:MAG: phosphohydrolase [Planctomycetota bacterium]